MHLYIVITRRGRHCYRPRANTQVSTRERELSLPFPTAHTGLGGARGRGFRFVVRLVSSIRFPPLTDIMVIKVFPD